MPSTFNWKTSKTFTPCFQQWKSSSENNSLWKSRMKNHPFHIVDPRPWPLTRACGTFFMIRGVVSRMNQFDYILMWIGVSLIVLTITQWWRDVRREATLQGKHTHKVEEGLRIGILLFITSEVFFFIGFFWAYFHASLSPNIEVGATWPPLGIKTITPFDVPLLNTIILLSRGASITWAHISILTSKWVEFNIRIGITVSLGCLFTLLQWIEYMFASFSMADSVYGSAFFLATGFHGLHVVIGTLFIRTIWLRHSLGHFSHLHHFGFEGRAWYWHFVDVVWLLLFLCIYWWGL